MRINWGPSVQANFPFSATFDKTLLIYSSHDLCGFPLTCRAIVFFSTTICFLQVFLFAFYGSDWSGGVGLLLDYVMVDWWDWSVRLIRNFWEGVAKSVLGSRGHSKFSHFSSSSNCPISESPVIYRTRCRNQLLVRCIPSFMFMIFVRGISAWNVLSAELYVDVKKLCNFQLPALHSKTRYLTKHCIPKLGTLQSTEFQN